MFRAWIKNWKQICSPVQEKCRENIKGKNWKQSAIRMKTRGLGVSFQCGRQNLCHEYSSPCIELSKNNLINDKKGNIKRGAEKAHFLCLHHFRVTNAVAQGMVSIHLHASRGLLPTSTILLSSLKLRPGKHLEEELFISAHSNRGVGLWLTGSLALNLPPACVSR